MIPEFKFKKQSNTQKKTGLKSFVNDKRVRIAGAVAAGAIVLGVSAFALIPDSEDVKKESITAMMQTAGVTTQIEQGELALQKKMDATVASVSKMDAAKTSVSMETAGFSANLPTKNAVTAKKTSEATKQAVEKKPARTKLVGFSNPGIANVNAYVNIRQEPDESSAVCGKLSKNQACEVLSKEDNGWYGVVTNGVYGYIKSEYLTTGDAAWEKAEKLKYAYVRVTTETLMVREKTSTNSDVIAMVSIDQKLDLVEQKDGWYKVSVDGKKGYVNAQYVVKEYTLPRGESVEIEEEEETSGSSSSGSSSSSRRSSRKSSGSSKSYRDCSNVVDYALQFVGNPYVYGGTSLTNGTDCSGFTMSVYKKFGVSLPHSSSAQARCGTKVSSSDMKPGDLVFYGKGSGINHVAMYIGGGKVVHASTRRTGIKVSNAFYRTPVTVRRVK